MKASSKLKQLEEENEDAMFVIVSDVWLDNAEVMEKLNIMFSGVVLEAFMGKECALYETLVTLSPCFFFGFRQDMQPCLLLASFSAGTSLRPHMGKRRSNPSKVSLLGP